jgi:hypothetical protein
MPHRSRPARLRAPPDWSAGRWVSGLHASRLRLEGAIGAARIEFKVHHRDRPAEAGETRESC